MTYIHSHCSDVIPVSLYIVPRKVTAQWVIDHSQNSGSSILSADLGVVEGVSHVTEKENTRLR